MSCLVSSVVTCIVAAQLVGCGAPAVGEGIGDAGSPTVTAPAPATASGSVTGASSATSPATSASVSATTLGTTASTTTAADAGAPVTPPSTPDPVVDAGVAVAIDAGTEPVVDSGTTLPTSPAPVADAGTDAAAPTGPVTPPPALTPPHAIFGSVSLDLARADCGGAAVSTSFTVTNSGAQTLSVAATTGTGLFSVSPSRADIAPGQSTTLTIGAAVTSQATAGIALTGALALTTNDPDQPHASVPLSVTPFGAALAWVTGAAANFGLAHLLGAASPLSLSLVNRGNLPADVLLGAPSDPAFSLAPSGHVSVAVGATASFAAGFLPSLLSTITATAAVSTTTPVCGAPPAAVTLSGQGGAGSISGWPSGLLDFGANACGGAAPLAQGFTLVNSGAFDVHLTSAGFSGSLGYASDAAGATIPAHGQLQVHVSAPPIPFPSPVPGLFADTLTVATDVPGDPVHLVPVTEAAFGAVLALDTTATSAFGAFGGIPLLGSTLESFAVRNTGNAPTTVTLSTGGAFSLTTPSFSLPAGASLTDAVSFVPSVVGAVSGALGVAATQLCQPAPSALPLVGVGQKGGLSVSVQSLSFAASCGSTATAQSLSLTNTGNVAVGWSASLGRGLSSAYDVSPSSGTVQPGGAPTVVTVTPRAIPQYPAALDPIAFADTLSLTTDVPGDAPHLVSLAETALGDVLSWSTGALDFGAVPVNSVASAQSFTLTNHANVGSAPASVSFASTRAVAFPLSLSSTTVGAQSTSSAVPVSFAPGAVTGLLGAAIDLATSDALCAPLPAPLPVSGSGTLAQVIASVTSLDFGQVNCGSAAGGQSILLTNGGNADYHVTSATLGLGLFYDVTIVPADGIVRASGANTVTVTVTPRSIPGVVPAVPALATYSDVLTLTTDAAGDVPRLVPLSMGARGVIVDDDLSTSTWGFGSVTLGQVGSFSASLHNAGNAPVSLSVTGLAGSAFSLASNPVVEASSPGFVTLQASFAPSLLTGLLSATATLSVTPAPGAVMCQPLPQSWTHPTLSLSGTALALPGLQVPSSLAFAPVVCGGVTSGSQPLVVTNLAGVTASFTASLEKGTYYHLETTTGSLGPLGTTLLTVDAALPSSGVGVVPGSAAYADRVVIVASGATYYVPISATLEGAVLALSSSGTVNVDGVLAASTTLTNSGNFATTVVPTFGRTSFVATPALDVLLGGGSASVLLSYAGTSSCLFHQTEASTMSFTATGLCQPAPTLSLLGCH